MLWLLPSAQVENPAQVLPLKENSAQKAELSNVVSAEQSALAEGEKTSAEKDGDEADDGDETSDARDSNADSDADGGDGDGDGDGDNDEDAEEETTTAAPRPAAVRTTTEAPKELPGGRQAVVRPRRHPVRAVDVPLRRRVRLPVRRVLRRDDASSLLRLGASEAGSRECAPVQPRDEPILAASGDGKTEAALN